MPEPEGLLPTTDLQRETLEEAIQGYQFELATAADAMAQLERRGLGPEVVAGARLGLVGDEAPAEHRHLIGWLAIPYLSHKGYPLTVRFRCMAHPDGCKAAGHKMKYAALPHDPARTYNIPAIHRAAHGDGSIHICEGELDALILQQMGLNAIALPGADGWRPRHRIMLAGFNEVQIWVDMDGAGDKLAAAIQRSIRTARRVRLPDGMDVGETYTQHGEAALWEALEGGK